jgi:hypothetical protein
MKNDDKYDELLRRLKRAADALDEEWRISRTMTRVMALFTRSIATVNRKVEVVTGKSTSPKTQRARKKSQQLDPLEPT